MGHVIAYSDKHESNSVPSWSNSKLDFLNLKHKSVLEERGDAAKAPDVGFIMLK